MNRDRLIKSIAALGAFLVLIQIFQPRRTNPPVIAANGITARTQIPESVHSALIRACGDCHSNRTRWPWYSRVAPLSWVMTDDVNQGRKRMNLDDWDASASHGSENDRVAKMCKEVQQGGMPPFSYKITHLDSQLTPPDITLLCAWSQSVQGDPHPVQNLR